MKLAVKVGDRSRTDYLRVVIAMLQQLHKEDEKDAMRKTRKVGVRLLVRQACGS